MSNHKPALPALPLRLPFRTAALPTRKPVHFDLKPDGATQSMVARLLGISGVKGLTFRGTISPAGKHDFVLEGQLKATVIQPCDLTLAPVTTKISEKVTRRYLAEAAPPGGDEVEMPEDDSEEPLPEVIDVGAVAIEALTLALPLYPRARGAVLGETVFAAPGAEPQIEADLKPFASLATLKDRLTAPEE